MKSPIAYSYIGGSITVPLQLVEFNLILMAPGKPDGSTLFWKLLGGTRSMLVFGLAGEVGAMIAWSGFAIGMSRWPFIFSELFEAGNTS